METALHAISYKGSYRGDTHVLYDTQCKYHFLRIHVPQPSVSGNKGSYRTVAMHLLRLQRSAAYSTRMTTS